MWRWSTENAPSLRAARRLGFKFEGTSPSAALAKVSTSISQGTARRRSRRGLGKFGQNVARVVPARGLGSPHVQLRSVGDWRVETPQPQQHVRLVRPIGDDMRAASGAKPPKLAGRRFEARQQLFAAQPAKRLPGHRHDRRKRGPMGRAAGRAMAMDDRARRSIDLVGDGTAKAATCQHD